MDEAAAPFARRTLQSMGTFAELLLAAPSDVAEPWFDQAEAELRRLETIMTRFNPESPIERLNDSGGGLTTGALRAVLEEAIRAWDTTDGRVDVCIGSDLIRAGYDRDFDELDVPSFEEIVAGAAAASQAAVAIPQATRRAMRMSIDSAGRVVIEPGTRVDLGGIAKGWAADYVRDLLAPVGSCLVNLGGDISLHVAPGDEPWPVGVELASETISLDVSHGGMATSGQDRRAWRVDDEGHLAHHVIDPRTGESARSDILRVTVFGQTCVDAEIWAKALFIAGADAARAEAEARGITCIIVGTDGASHGTGALAGV